MQDDYYKLAALGTRILCDKMDVCWDEDMNTQWVVGGGNALLNSFARNLPSFNSWTVAAISLNSFELTLYYLCAHFVVIKVA